MEKWDLRDVDLQAHHPQVLASSDEGRTILLLLPAGERLQEHRVHERSWVLVVDGEIEIDNGGEATVGGPGLLALFDPNEPNEVRATTEARLLMVLAPWPGNGHPSQASR